MMARAEETTKNEGEWAFLPTSNAQSIQDFADRTLSWRGLLLLREPEPLSCSVGVPAGELEGRPAPSGFERRDAAETRSRDGCATTREDQRARARPRYPFDLCAAGSWKTSTLL
jgi:hypothetical protein